MNFELRLVVEKVVTSTQEAVKRDTVKVYDVTSPKSILNLGLYHREEIALLKKIHNAVLAEQTKLIDGELKVYPNCRQKLSRNGYTQSQLQAVF